MQETEEFLKGLTRGISNTIRLAYERGVKDGEEHREAKALKNMAEYSQSRFQDGYEQGYEQGVNEVWEAVKRFVIAPKDGGLTSGQIEEIFGDYQSLLDIFHEFSVQEVLEKLKAWDDEQNVITVGDEVEDGAGIKSVVIAVNEKQASLLNFHYSLVQLMPLKDLHKTGRHFDEVTDLLEKLKGEKLIGGQNASN